MIPKVIHYCWFGGNPLPPLAIKCIESWKKYLPDYEIKEWNESNFNVNMIPYVREAYAAKKYAFVSDYARFWILYKYGGIYFDTDVEVIRRMDDIIERGNFMGMETDADENNFVTGNVAPGLGLGVNPGLGLGVNPGLGLMKKMLDYYDGKHFVLETNASKQITVVDICTEVLKENGLQLIAGIQKVADDCYIYPAEYFCPTNLTTGRIHVKPNTRTIHHYAGSWVDNKYQFKNFIKKLLPEKLIMVFSEWKSKKNK